MQQFYDPPLQSRPINILLADDNLDDRFFFQEALTELPISTDLTTVVDGERLMTHLFNNPGNPPDVVFLDLNMPRRNGSECLIEIKQNKLLQSIPVIIYSTSLHEVVTDQLFKNGAHHYMLKTSISELKMSLYQVLSLMLENKLEKPCRSKFVMEAVRV
jgi:CheY-like chemotaxis protein